MSEHQWKTVSVVGFDELMQALERADRKGYMPDAIKEDWEAFNWKPEQPAQKEPFGYFRYDLRLDAWVQNRFNNKGVAFYVKEQK